MFTLWLITTALGSAVTLAALDHHRFGGKGALA